MRCGTRATGLHQALPWVRLAMEPLAGQQVPIWEEDVFGLWQRSGLAQRLQDSALEAGNGTGRSRTGPRSTASLPQLLEELVDVGVLSRRTSGQLDMPDVYRVVYGLGRRGGVKRTATGA
ncbi:MULTISPECIES: hypothetical protein [unclassified Streptomyces]|uniref:hypothetical protein n=1 Tax=unclassified Streptomyces TaxID=2593676 RepID=UPI00366888D7